MSTSNKNGYLLLFQTDEWYKQLSREEVQAIIAKNKAWYEQLAAQGKIKGGQALERKSAVVSRRNGRVVSDVPFAESKEAIGGFLLLDVDSYEEAIAIARTSPNLAYNTKIEVRPVSDECPLDAWGRELAQQELATTH